MNSIAHFVTPESPCGYLADQQWRLEYDWYNELNASEYADLMLKGWRRFGHAVFRPRCRSCQACQSLRIDVQRFQPNRSQTRNRRRNEGAIRLVIGAPHINATRLALYDRYHRFQTEHVGWRAHDPKDPGSYIESFVNNPFPTEEWRYFFNKELIGIGYVDVLPVGLSAIYFYHAPEHRKRGLGIWNILCLLDRSRQLGNDHLYLGYFVKGCRSLEYKADFRPNQIFTAGQGWRDFRHADGTMAT